MSLCDITMISASKAIWRLIKLIYHHSTLKQICVDCRHPTTKLALYVNLEDILNPVTYFSA